MIVSVDIINTKIIHVGNVTFVRLKLIYIAGVHFVLEILDNFFLQIFFSVKRLFLSKE